MSAKQSRIIRKVYRKEIKKIVKKTHTMKFTKRFVLAWCILCKRQYPTF